MEEELIKNAEEFYSAGKENLSKGRFNVAISDFFKTIVILCDFLIYKEFRTLPKNHHHRFTLLENYFKEIYKKVSELFKSYTKSYNLRTKKSEAQEMEEYANELKRIVDDKK